MAALNIGHKLTVETFENRFVKNLLPHLNEIYNSEQKIVNLTTKKLLKTKKIAKIRHICFE